MSPSIHAELCDYRACLAFLDDLDISAMKLGTERVRAILKHLENPQDQVRTIHVVGTNGKGSLCTYLESIYRAAGYRTGLFISPHLVDLRERIQWQGQPIPAPDFVETACTVYEVMCRVFPDQQDWLTYFEFINIMAFRYFADRHVDVAIIEAGLGGRLDSTNVIESPVAVVVTPISMDHVERLGPTLADIAREKAGVFRPGVKAFTAVQPEPVRQVLMAEADRVKVASLDSEPVLLRPGRLGFDGENTYRLMSGEGDSADMHYFSGLLGRYQSENLGLALRVVQELQPELPVSQGELSEGVRLARWPGRFQLFREKNLVIDGSHNAAGIETLLQTLSEDFPNTPVHWGISLLANRRPDLLKPLYDYPETASVTFISDNEPGRFHTPQTLRGGILGLDSPAQIRENRALQAFLERPSPPECLTVLTGSLYTAGRALALLSQS